MDPGARDIARETFGFYVGPQPLTTLIGQLDEGGIDQAVLSTLDCTSSGRGVVASNEHIAELVELSNGRLLGFASVDPNLEDARSKLRHAVKDLGLRGLNLDPALQNFSLRDESVFGVFEEADELGIPVVIQSGLNWSPIARTGSSRPIDIEVVAEKFPNLPIVVAHCGWPWVDEALALAIKYPNVYLDTAVLYGGRPESTIDRIFGQQIGTDVVEASLRDKIVFASDYPRVDPKRVARGIKMLGLRPATERMIMGANALSLLKEGN